MLLPEVEKKKKKELSNKLQMIEKTRKLRIELSPINLLRKVGFRENLHSNVCLKIENLRKPK
jgi:hypothetical protein